jgi:hypothetical protein
MSSGARVVLVDDRAPPLQHLALDGHRAGRGGVDREAQAGGVVAGPLGLGQAQHADEHGGDELGVGHPVALDHLEALAGIEPLHHHHRGPEALHRHRVDQRGRVVQRGRAQVHRAGADPALGGQRLGQQDRRGRGIAQRRARQHLAHTLGPPGGARGVQHLPALALVVGRQPGRTRHHVVVALEAGHVPHRDADRDAGQVEVGHHLGHGLGGDQRHRAAVVQHVLDLARAQVAVDGRVVEP